MKVITEAVLRSSLGRARPEVYQLPEGSLLSPAAREYLAQQRIRVVEERKDTNEKQSAADRTKQDCIRRGKRNGTINEIAQDELWKSEKGTAVDGIAQELCRVQTNDKENRTEQDGLRERNAEAAAGEAENVTQEYEDYETGAIYRKKPEHMTQLSGDFLVCKDHPRIVFRGKLDSLQSQVVLAQAILAEKNINKTIIVDLNDVLEHLRELMRCDVLDEPLPEKPLFGMTGDELREHSHHPMKYYRIRSMTLPDYTMGQEYALLNRLRTAVRETEAVAVLAFRQGGRSGREDIIRELNRLSSGLHIMMCRYLAGEIGHADV